MPFVCESDLSELKELPLHEFESAPVSDNDPVELLCPSTFPSDFTELKFELKCARARRNSCQCECAMHKSSENQACGGVFIHTTHSDREAHVHHHAVGLTQPQRVISRFFIVSGWVFRF